jgi:hypothetical protein
MRSDWLEYSVKYFAAKYSPNICFKINTNGNAHGQPKSLQRVRRMESALGVV